MKALVLAAGRGQRLAPLTDQRPKPLIEVGGKSLILRQLQALAEAGVHDIIVNLGWLGEQIPAALGDGRAAGVSIRYSDEGWPALETGGAIRQALPMLGDQPFLLVNADLLCDIDYRPLLSVPLAPRKLGHLVLVPNPAHQPGGDFSLRDGEVGNADDARYTYSGVSVLDPKLLDGAPDGRFALAPILRDAAADGRLSGELHGGYWIDVGTPERLAAARARYA